MDAAASAAERARGRLSRRRALACGARLVVELQGYEYHAHRQAFDHDHAKPGRLTLAGYQVLPLTYRQLKQERDWVVASLRALLRAARSAVPAPTL
jgi:very-short-patch-repair endonuclease